MLSEESKFSEYLREKCKIGSRITTPRRPICGVGINDADYATQPVIDGVNFICPAYSTWSGVMARTCNSKFIEKHPTYKDVSICKQWLIFSNFRKWFIENHISGYHLDKDILSSDKKIYSPETCLYIPSWLNGFIASSDNRKRKNSMIGTNWEERLMKYKAQCNNPKTKVSEYLGLYETEDAAHNAWLKRKLEFANELKPEMDEIDLRIYTNVIRIIKRMK